MIFFVRAFAEPLPKDRPIPAKAGISAAAKRRVIVPSNLRLRRGDSCLRRNGTGG
ncbi:MAG: hypothetical protein ACR2QC_11575 [Gammaproteobacteria bacterium]